MLEYVPECFRVIRHVRPEAELQTLRTDRASCGTGPADCAWVADLVRWHIVLISKYAGGTGTIDPSGRGRWMQ